MRLIRLAEGERLVGIERIEGLENGEQNGEQNGEHGESNDDAGPEH